MRVVLSCHLSCHLTSTTCLILLPWCFVPMQVVLKKAMTCATLCVVQHVSHLVLVLVCRAGARAAGQSKRGHRWNVPRRAAVDVARKDGGRRSAQNTPGIALLHPRLSLRVELPQVSLTHSAFIV